MDLAADDAVAHAAIAAVRKKLKGCTIIVPPTVIQELNWLAENAETEDEQELAKLAAAKMRLTWEFVPVNCIPVGHCLTDLAAQELRERGLLPHEEINDSFIITESALGECSLIISADRHMWGIDIAAVNQVLVRRDLSALVIAAPWKIAKDYAST